MMQELVQEIVTSPAVTQPKSHNHVIVALWVFVALSIVEAFALLVTFKARGGWSYLATIPMTNLRSLAAIVMFVVAIVGTGLVGYLAGVWPPENIYDTTMYVLTIWSGIEVGAMWIKRKTGDDRPSTQNVMAAQAAAGVQVDARAARDVADPATRVQVPTAEFPTVDVTPAKPNVTDDNDGLG